MARDIIDGRLIALRSCRCSAGGLSEREKRLGTASPGNCWILADAWQNIDDLVSSFPCFPLYDI